jgi:curli biogenesis system outer membrane secretion channel CsgG
MQIAVYPFVDNSNQHSELGNIITDEFWGNLVNEGRTFQVMERAQLDYYLAEHKLESDGLINPTTAKQFGMLIAADAYVTGKVFVVNSYLRLKVKVVDTETGQILATASGKLPLNYDMAEYLGVENWREKKIVAEQNRSTNPNCDEMNVGDFCFENKTNQTYKIQIQDISNKSPLSTMFRHLTVQPGETNCFRDLPIKNYAAILSQFDGFAVYEDQRTNFYIEECGAGRYIIK